MDRCVMLPTKDIERFRKASLFRLIRQVVCCIKKEFEQEKSILNKISRGLKAHFDGYLVRM